MLNPNEKHIVFAIQFSHADGINKRTESNENDEEKQVLVASPFGK